MIRIALILTLWLIASPVHAEIRILPEKSFVSGFSPGITVTGMVPGSTARLHAYGSFSRWDSDGKGGWVQSSQIYHAWTDIRADRKGRVEMDRYKVTRGTYSGVDGYGLLWSMRKPTDAALVGADPTGNAAPTPGPNDIVLLLTQNGQVIGHGKLREEEAAGLTVEPVTQGRLNGYFAAPAGAKKLPVVILLHGSEGGSMDGARALATRYAARGFAAFAFNYFAWDLKQVKGPPNYHVNQPIEMIAQVRDWLAMRPEVDIKRIGLYGHSKGAEYAVVAASYYSWIKAVVACTPSDVVWEGYGINDGRNVYDANLKWPEQRSSWSWQGQPLPYVPLLGGEDRKWFDNTERYSVSRAESSGAAKTAAIPVERARAKFLLLGGGRDEVWASGDMAETLGKKLGKRAVVQVYPAAGHQICGAGTYPSHIWADASTDSRVKDPLAEGSAQVDAWQRTVAFLKQAL